MKNPYLEGPYTNEAADAWWMGFLRGFADTNAGFELPPGISSTDADAYGEGVQAGRQASIDGIPLGDRGCIPARAGSPSSEIAGSVGWSVWSVGGLFFGSGGPAGMVARAIISILRLGWSGAHTVDPDLILPDLVDPFVEELRRAGLDHLALYMGVGRDPAATDCEFIVTGLHTSLATTRETVVQLGRRDWFIAEWRTDQSSFNVVEDSGFEWD